MSETRIDGARELSARLQTSPAQMRAALLAKCQELAERLQRHIQDDGLEGQALRVRSGALRDSIHAEVNMVGDAPVARVFSEGVKYALAQEYGFQGSQAVSGFNREIREAFGRAIDPKTVFVKSFTRNMNLPAHYFMRDGLNDLRDDIRVELLAVVKESLHA